MKAKRAAKAGRGRPPSQRPSKTCQQCGLPFTWRKKWERDWQNVRYCSERCRRAHRAAHPAATPPEALR